MVPLFCVLFVTCVIPLAVNVVNEPAFGDALPIIPWKLAPVTVFSDASPLTVSPVSVPSDVTFGCAAVLKVPVRTAPLLPIVAALIVCAVSVLLTVTSVKVPAEGVMLPITPWKLAPVAVFHVNVVNAPVPGVTFPIALACSPPIDSVCAVIVVNVPAAGAVLPIIP